MSDACERLEKQVTKNTEDITDIKINMSKLETNVNTLVDSQKRTDNMFKAFMGSCFAVLIGFIVWYIQTIPR